MNLSEALISNPVREISGGRSANRFAFQQSWGICLTLKLHSQTTDDYCVLFEAHEDIVSLDNWQTPTAADFYQIKSDAKRWTLAAVTYRKPGKNQAKLPSIMGKLYEQLLKFGNFARRITFVSIAKFDVKMAGETASTNVDSICLANIHADELQELGRKMKDEHSLESAPDDFSVLYLDLTTLSVLDHERHTEGIVSDFLSQLEDTTIAPRPFHKALRAEVQRRTNKEFVATSFSDLVSGRGITRPQLTTMIGSVASDHACDDLYEFIRGQLEIENLPPRQRKAVLDGVREFFAARLDETNLILADAVKAGRRLILDLPDSVLNAKKPFTVTLEYLSRSDEPDILVIRNNYSPSFVDALFLVLSNEQESSATNSQSEDEEV